MIDEKKMSKEGMKAFMEGIARDNAGNIHAKKKTVKRSTKKK